MNTECLSKQYSPVLLGEFIQKRSFTSSGEINPLSKSPNKSGVLQLQDGEIVQADEAAWEPRSLLSLLDGLEAVKWAYILTQIGDELDIEEYHRFMYQRFRSRPQKLERLAAYWLSASWRLCMLMRAGRTYRINPGDHA